MKLASKVLLVLLVIFIAGSALYGVVEPAAQSRVLRRMITAVPWAGYTHIVAGSLAMILGAFQMSSRLRKRHVKLHRRIGNSYVACVLISTVGAIASLPFSTSPLSAVCGFWLLAIVWPIVTLAGYPWRGRFNLKRHGTLMIYSYALTCAAISLRLILIPLLISGVPFRTAYPIAAWGGGLGNVLLVFVLMRIIQSRVENNSKQNSLQNAAT